MTCFDYLRDAQAPEIDCENEYVRCVRTDVARAHDAALDVTRDEPARHLTWYRYAIRPEKNTLCFRWLRFGGAVGRTLGHGIDQLRLRDDAPTLVSRTRRVFGPPIRELAPSAHRGRPAERHPAPQSGAGDSIKGSDQDQGITSNGSTTPRHHRTDIADDGDPA